jgi:hypothetical protein
MGYRKINHFKPDNVISFASKTTNPCGFTKNSLDNKTTSIYHIGELPSCFDTEIVKNIYGYQFELKQIADSSLIPSSSKSIILITNEDNVGEIAIPATVDFHISLHGELGSILVVNGAKNENYVAAIQHVRRRAVAMTPADSLIALQLCFAKAIATTETVLEKAVLAELKK